MCSVSLLALLTINIGIYSDSLLALLTINIGMCSVSLLAILHINIADTHHYLIAFVIENKSLFCYRSSGVCTKAYNIQSYHAQVNHPCTDCWDLVDGICHGSAAHTLKSDQNR